MLVHQISNFLLSSRYSLIYCHHYRMVDLHLMIHCRTVVWVRRCEFWLKDDFLVHTLSVGFACTNTIW